MEGEGFYLPDIKNQWKVSRLEETSDLPLMEPVWLLY